jgi:hypothetical protein
MGGCVAKQLKWAPSESDGDADWMNDYDGMVYDMVQREYNTEQWELDLGMKNRLTNPPWKKEGELVRNIGLT